MYDMIIVLWNSHESNFIKNAHEFYIWNVGSEITLLELLSHFPQGDELN